MNTKVTTNMDTDHPIKDSVMTSFYMYITKGHTFQDKALTVSEGILNVNTNDYSISPSSQKVVHVHDDYSTSEIENNENVITVTEPSIWIIEESTHLSSLQNTSSVDFIHNDNSSYYMSVIFWICGVVVVLLCIALFTGSCMWIKHHFHFLRHNLNNPGKILTTFYIYI